MAEPKTKPTDVDVDEFLATWPTPKRQDEARVVKALMERVTGAPAVMWGPTMVGFGSLPYTNTLGTNNWFLVGFSPRKTDFTIYGVQDGYGPPDPLLDALGPHTLGKSCLYIRSLDKIDLGVLEQLVRNAWEQATGSASGADSVG